MAWTADELYGQNSTFLNGLDARHEAFVVEVPVDLRVWMVKPEVLRNPPQNAVGRPKKYPRLGRGERDPSEVRNLSRYSPAFRKQTPQRYRIKDTHRGSEVWEIRWATCWRQTHDDRIVSNQCTLVVARNVLTGEVKYFLSNRVLEIGVQIGPTSARKSDPPCHWAPKSRHGKALQKQPF